MDEANKQPAGETPTSRTEKKKRGPVARLIPWILGGLLGIGLVWVFMNIASMPDDTAALAVDTLQSPNLNAQKPAAADPPAAVDRVAEFIRFADQNRAARVGPEHIYTGDGIARLADAIDALSEQFMADSTEMEPGLKRLRDAAETVRQDPSGRSAEVRAAFQLAADLLSSVQRQSFPQAATQVNAVRQAALAVTTERPIAEQIAAVEAYFRQAGSTLQTMMAPEVKPSATAGTDVSS